MLFPQTVLARRTTPADIIDTKKATYEEKVKSYSSTHQAQLKKFSEEISRVNEYRSNQLRQIMDTQAAILDEFQRRHEGQYKDSVEKARYWITFAHEAVAYQQAKVYVFALSDESLIKEDSKGTISLLRSDLSYARSQVINSQNILEGLLKNEN